MNDINDKNIDDDIPENFLDSSHYVYITIEQWARIKKDLSVLEILRKKKVEIMFISIMGEVLETEDLLEDYNSALTNEERKLTLEELILIKEWLGVEQ